MASFCVVRVSVRDTLRHAAHTAHTAPCSFCLRKLGQYAAAAADYGWLIDRGARTVRNFNSRAFCRASMGEYAAAVDDYSEAIKVGEVWGGWGWGHAFLSFSCSVHSILCPAASQSLPLRLPPATPAPMQLDASNVHAHFNRAITHDKIGMRQAAIDDFTRCLALDPTNAGAYYNRANLFDANGQYAAAVQDYRRALEAEK